MADATDSAYLISILLGEIIKGPKAILSIMCFTDNKLLYDASHTTNIISERRLIVDLSILREIINKNEITLERLDSAKQLANVLTKRGAFTATLLYVLRNGKLCF